MRFRHLLLAGLVACCASLAPAARAQSCLGAADGTECADDLDPCTQDRCDNEQCQHVPLPLLQACAPIDTPYKRVLVLTPFAVGLRLDVLDMPEPDLPAQRRASLASEVGIAAVRLGVLENVLAGHSEDGGDFAQTRAAAGISYAKEAQAAVKRFLSLLRNTQRAAEIDAETARVLRRSARDLLRGCNDVKRDLGRLNKVSQVFRP